MICIVLTDYNQDLTNKNFAALALIGVVCLSIGINATNLIIGTTILVKK